MNVAIIPARGNSVSVPRKNLRPIAGKPLLLWTIEAAKLSRVFDYIVLTSESDEILQLGIQSKIMTLVRPSQLSQNHVQTNEVALDALRQLQLANVNPDIVTILQPTSPFRTADDIRGAADLFNNWPLELDQRGTLVSAHKSAKYHWHDEGWNDKPLYHNPEKRLGRQWEVNMGVFVEQGAIYMVSANRFGREGQYRLPPYQIFEMSEDHGLDIDSESDLALAIYLYEKRNK